MWYEPENIFAIEKLSGQEWLIFAAVNVAFYLFLITIAPRLRAFLRGWRRAEDRVADRFVKYYGAIGGPSVVPRNVVPELCVAIYVYFGLISLWILTSPVLAVIWFGLAGITLLIWRGVGLVGKLAAHIKSRRRQQDLDDSLLNTNPEDFASAPSDTTP